MSGVKKKKTAGGLYQAWFTDYTGKRRYFTAMTRSEAKSEAQRLEGEHRLIRQGFRPVPSAAHDHRKRSFHEVMEEYLAWGTTQGGRGGRPWADWHARKRCTHLNWWQAQLSLTTLGEISGALPRVEKQLRALQRTGKAGKTIANYAEALSAFCDWCKQRGYLSEDPLAGLAPFDTTPVTQRRAMTAEEIGRLLEACAPHRRLLLETAFFSGLRVNELRNLKAKHLDVERGGVRLEAEWTKNRKPGFQPLSWSLVERLRDFAQAGEAGRLYQRYARKTTTIPDEPLLYVPSSPSRDLAKDLEAAGIPRSAPGGKLDFHACRVAYVSLVIESGVTVKEAQELARHSVPDLTMNVYGRVQGGRLADAAERVADAVLGPKRVPAEYRQAVGAETKNATLNNYSGLRKKQMVELRGIEPLTS